MIIYKIYYKYNDIYLFYKKWYHITHFVIDFQEEYTIIRLFILFCTIIVIMTHKNHTLTVSTPVYDMLDQIKTIFVSYTGEDKESFSDEKVIEILASGFLGSDDAGHEEDGCCGGGQCGSDDKKE